MGEEVVWIKPSGFRNFLADRETELSSAPDFEIGWVVTVLIWILDLRACFGFRASNFGFRYPKLFIKA
jgi:hypothetical protein